MKNKIERETYDDESEEEYSKRIASVIRGWKNYFDNDRSDDNDKENNYEAYNNGAESLKSTALDNNSNSNYSITRLKEELFDEINTLIDTGRTVHAVSKIKKVLTDDEIELSNTERSNYKNKLGQLYILQGMYGAAEKCGIKPEDGKNLRSSFNNEPVFGNDDIKKWLEVFGFTKDRVYRQYIDKMGRHGYKPASGVLNCKYLKEHWIGRHTLAVSVYGKENNVRFGVIDLDVSRKMLDNSNADKLEELRKRLLDDAINIVEIAHQAGIEGIIENSGYKGYHVWFFFYNALSAELVKSFLQTLIKKAKEPVPGTHREVFPANKEKPLDRLNSRIKLPLGIHRLNNRRSCFISPEGTAIKAGIQLLKNRVYYSTAKQLKNAVASWNMYNEYSKIRKSNTENRTDELVLLDKLYEGCDVLRYIKKKAENEKFLTHYERTVVRGVLQPLGSEGVQEIHSILKNCDNYSKKVTDSFLGNKNYKPMGCARIKEILNYLTAELECNCKFKPKKNDYSNPLRHLNNHYNHDRRKSKNINEKVEKKTPINVNAEISQLLSEYRDLRKQLINKQKQIYSMLEGNSFADLGVGILKNDGHDKELKRWIIEI